MCFPRRRLLLVWETDYFEANWQDSFWGDKYARPFFESAAERAFRAICAQVSNRTLIRETFTAKEWKNGNDLVIHAFGEYQFVQGKAYTPFAYFGTFHVIGSTFGFVTGEASKLK